MENKVSQESARESLNVFLEYYEIDISLLPDGQRVGVEASLAKAESAIMRGKLEIALGSEGVVSVTQYVGKERKKLEYAELNGLHKVQMKKAAENAHHERAYILVGGMTGVGLDGILKLKGADLGLAEVMGSLYMQV